MSTLRQVIKALEKHYPLSRAESWDSVGLLVGDAQQPIKKVLVAHEITNEVLEAAEDCDAILAYHPLLFRPLAKLDFSDHTAKLVAECIRRELSVVAAHTALDNAPLGQALGDGLARQLELENIGVLQASGRETVYQIAVYVPHDALEAVSDALWQAGAGNLGNYSEASFRSEGTGTFKPEEGANPYDGSIGTRETVQELKLEVIVPESARDAAVAAMKEAHPYEEVAYAVYPLHNTVHPYGSARVGELPEEVSIEAFALRVGTTLLAPNVRLVQSGPTVRKVACVPGSGASFIKAAVRAGCDVLVTGDIKHHDALQAKALGLSLVDVTHVATEHAAVAMLCDALAGLDDVEVVPYTASTNPFEAI